ncbi:MAG: hypothetical protein KGL74_02180 [Elusimicrobia bacterium]|nr:hypothetical protein [Elusimicrobiota bacterium]
MKRAAVFVPVLLRFAPAAGRQDAWGRLTRLTSGGAELSTSARLTRDEGVLLSFELGGVRFDEVRGRVAHAEDDVDGHRLAELVFQDEVQRRALAKALVEVLSRS